MRNSKEAAFGDEVPLKFQHDAQEEYIKVADGINHDLQSEQRMQSLGLADQYPPPMPPTYGEAIRSTREKDWKM